MESAEILSILKYAGFLVSGASSVWGLIAKTTYEDENKQKRLLPAGHIAIAIALLGAVISMLAYGFETSIKSAVDRSAKLQAAADAAAASAKDAKLRAEQSDRDAQAREARSEARDVALKIVAQQTRSQLLVLDAAEKSRRQQERIQTGIDQATALSIVQAKDTLGRLERMAHPIEPVAARVVLRISTAGIENDPYLVRLRALAAKAVGQTDGDVVLSRNGTAYYRAVETNLPDKTDAAWFHYLNDPMRIWLISPQSTGPAPAANKLNLIYRIKGTITHIEYSKWRGIITVYTKMTVVSPDDIDLSRSLISSSDIVGSQLGIELSQLLCSQKETDI